jgi:beta-lactamase regulating signal transducer with metallopeptidase domain
MQQMLVSYLLNAAWQVPIVALCAYAIARFGGLSPRGRNGLWLLFLATAAVLPAVSLDAILPHALATVSRLPANAPVDAPAFVTAPPPGAEEPAVSLAPWSVRTMTTLFAAVALALIARLTVASLAARRLVGRARPVELPADILQSLDNLARAHRRRAPPIRSSARISCPAVVGAFRPVILIPDDMARQGEDLRAALLHETAHVIRNDYAINLACEVLTLPVCWHPALFAIKAGVRRSRELACDAIAAGAMTSPKTYAKCLVSLAQTLGATARSERGAPASAALAVGLFGRSDLEDRLMQLMKPADAEAPAIRVARLWGLAAVGAGLLGSAALLHVTPVLAQPAAPAPAPVTAAPLPAPAAAATDQARRDAGAEPAPRHRSGMIFSKKGVIIERGPSGYHHSFTASDGQQMTVINDDPSEPTAAQQKEWEDAARDAEARGAAAERMVNSPEFKARIERAKAQAAAAEKMVNSPEFKARIEKAKAQAAAAEKMVNSPEFKARIAKAEARAAEVEKMVNSPEFKARIAKAQADAEAAARMVNTPEFREQIEGARAQAEQARKMVNSPEFKAQVAEAKAQAVAARIEARASLERARADMAAAGVEMRRQRDDLRAQQPESDPHSTTP